MNHTPHYLTIAEAAEICCVSTQTIRRRINEGTLTGYKFGPRRVLINADELATVITGGAK
jgi:excisionase family DNA binding protein